MKKRIIYLTLFIAIMIACIWIDLPFAQWIYNPDSQFGQFFAVTGTFPLAVIGIWCSIAFVVTIRAQNLFWNIVYHLFGYYSLIHYYHYGYIKVIHDYPDNMWMVGFITVLMSLLFMFMIYKIIKKGKTLELACVSIIGLFCCYLAVDVVNLIKVLTGRPRFCTLANPATDFVPWYVFNFGFPNTSFPSGHSAQAALSFVPILLTHVINFKKPETYRTAVTIGASIFTLCVMVSRLIIGKHYISDVIVGALIPIVALFWLENYIFFKDHS